jgi:hypothetical protein
MAIQTTAGSCIGSHPFPRQVQGLRKPGQCQTPVNDSSGSLASRLRRAPSMNSSAIPQPPSGEPFNPLLTQPAHPAGAEPAAFLTRRSGPCHQPHEQTPSPTSGDCSATSTRCRRLSPRICTGPEQQQAGRRVDAGGEPEPSRKRLRCTDRDPQLRRHDDGTAPNNAEDFAPNTVLLTYGAVSAGGTRSDRGQAPSDGPHPAGPHRDAGSDAASIRTERFGTGSGASDRFRSSQPWLGWPGSPAILAASKLEKALHQRE